MALTDIDGQRLGDSVAPKLSNRNKIINGDMRIDQRNAGASVTPSSGTTYTVDRWFYFASQASKFDVQQNAGSVTPPTGFEKYLGFTVAAAVTLSAGDYFLTAHRIEGFNVEELEWGTANAKSVTISFWVRSSLTGSFGASVQNGASNRSYPFSYSISAADTWEYKTVTIPGDTSGTWETGNAGSVTLWIGLGVGSTLSGTAGSWSGSDYRSVTGATSVVGTLAATFYITGVQLEVGNTATPFERRSYGDELARCQRYYKEVLAMNQSSNSTFFDSYYGGSNAVRVLDVNMDLMRSSPNLAIKNSDNAAQYYSYTGSWTNSTVTASAIGVWPDRQLFIFMSADGDGRGKLCRRDDGTGGLGDMIATLSSEL